MRDFHDAGLALVQCPDAAGALVELVHSHVAAVLAPTDLVGMSLTDFTDIVVSFTSTPVIVGLADDSERAMAVRALDAGARAIVLLPFSPTAIAQELRRLSTMPAPGVSDEVRSGTVSLSVSAHRVQVEGVDVHLSPKEFVILEYLMRNSTRVVRLDELIHVFEGGDAHHVTRLRVMIAKIRARLAEAAPNSPDVLRTIRGVGYRISD